jgi:hypothetical protein
MHARIARFTDPLARCAAGAQHRRRQTWRGFAMPSVLEDKDQIRELLATYCFHFDEGKFDDWIELWTDDPVWDVDGRIARGRAECLKVARAVESVDGKPPMKHYIMNEVITVDGDKANVKLRYDATFMQAAADGKL